MADVYSMGTSAQSMVPRSMMRVLQQIEREAGLIGFVVLAGPEPQRGGDTKVIS